MNAEAAEFSKKSWNEAEEEMKSAAIELEKGDANDAKEKATKASALYRTAELESIKANYLSNAKKLIEKAEANKVHKTAPKTLNEAKELVSSAEKELVDNRYDTDEARYMAKEAEYKALLAMYIAQQAKILEDKDFQTEDYLLMMYEPINRIGENRGIEMNFDKGVEAPVLLIMADMENDKDRISDLETELYRKNRQNESLNGMLAEQRKIQEIMKGKLSEEALQAQKRQQILQNRINRVAEIDAKFDKIQQIFNLKEAEVFRQQDDIIIRMIGINFDVGKAQIKEEDYALLTKVKNAVNIFENAVIIIEGHTDSQGSDEINLELSKERANAVLSYLTANTDIDKERFGTRGFGESKPVANNETSAGRAQNRRIDIVIRPTILDTLVSN
jgi:outer membrane protein OmpA-like peptidoglycan-associated protein/HEPN domain-containing protein